MSPEWQGVSLLSELTGKPNIYYLVKIVSSDLLIAMVLFFPLKLINILERNTLRFPKYPISSQTFTD